MKKKKFKRRKIFIDKEFQTKFIMNIYLVIIVLVLLLGILLIYLSSREMSGSIYSKIVAVKNTRQLLLPLFLKITFIILLFAFVIVGARFLVFSHKIAGPMFRFRQTLKEIRAGDLTVNIRFRRKDELKDVAELLTSAVRALNKKIKEINKNSESIGNILAKKKISNSDIAKMKKYQNNIKLIISKFKL